MDKKYQHLTDQDRIFLRIMLEKRYSKGKIAEILGVHRSMIYREIKRNSCIHWYSRRKFYWSHSAQEKYLKRRKRDIKLNKAARSVLLDTLESLNELLSISDNIESTVNVNDAKSMAEDCTRCCSIM